jgi:peptidoglycan-N-acetylglucosamine deacetylase
MAAKIAYLTIDDSPTKDFIPKLEYLITKQIPAVWFCEGARLEQYPDSIITAIKAGYIIGNHSYSHPSFSTITLEKAFDEIGRTHQIVEDLYAQAGVPRPAKYFRFPYGDKGGLTGHDVFATYTVEGKERKDAIQQYLCDLGYTQPKFSGVTYQYYEQYGLLTDIDWHWTYDCMEWSVFQAVPSYGIDNLDKVLARMDENEPEGGRGLNEGQSEEIILLHDHVETTELFEPIIERLLAKGLEFRPVPLL